MVGFKMKGTFLLSLLAVSVGASANLVFWAPLNKDTGDAVGRSVGEIKGGATLLSNGQGLDLGGLNGVLFFNDNARYAMASSFSIAATVYVRKNPEGGTSPAGQIVFRGDDRGGLDNYSLCLGNDGFYTFYFNTPSGDGHSVRSISRMDRWENLLAVFDARNQDVRLYVNGFLTGESGTPLLPVTQMDNAWSPGLSIGNVQNPLGGRHNQPFNGLIRNVRIWDTVMFPDDVFPRPVQSIGRSGS